MLAAWSPLLPVVAPAGDRRPEVLGLLQTGFPRAKLQRVHTSSLRRIRLWPCLTRKDQEVGVVVERVAAGEAALEGGVAAGPWEAAREAVALVGAEGAAPRGGRAAGQAAPGGAPRR